MTDFSFIHRLLPDHVKLLSQFTKQVPVQVGALAQALGLKVVVAALPLNISGMIQPDGDGGFVVKVNRFEPKERQRFTIAHEIAHYLLHRDRISMGVVDSVLYRSKLSSRLEAEANKLAADIIMPMDQVQAMVANAHQSGDDLLALLAETFQVSKQAMGIRTG